MSFQTETTGPAVDIQQYRVCLLLEGYSPVCSLRVGEKAYHPFKPIEDIESYPQKFLHLLGVRALVVQSLPSHRRVALVEQRAEPVYRPEVPRREMFCVLNLHLYRV